MRLNVAVSGLLACSIGISAAGTTERLALRQSTGITPAVPTQNSIIKVTSTYPDLSTTPVISREDPLTFVFETNGTEINTVSLKIFNSTGSDTGNDDKVIRQTTFPSSQPASSTDGEGMLNSDERGPSDDSFLTAGPGNKVIIDWSKADSSIFGSIDKPLYLEFEWTKLSSSGISTTQLFAVYDAGLAVATQNLNSARDSNFIGAPARQETPSPTSQAPSPNPNASASPSSGTTSQPAATSGAPSQSPSSEPSRSSNGLHKNGIIGVAVGVTVGGLLVAGTVLWLFCFRRRRRAATHHAMGSYSSDVGGHAMMQDKEIPVVLESTSPRSAYGGRGDEERSSADHYAPYSDRSTTSPTPDHPVTTTGTATAAPADVGATSQTGGAPTPTPFIASRYAHLVEEGMTEDEIRRLEEEERQLDAAIETAGRRGTS